MFAVILGKSFYFSLLLGVCCVLCMAHSVVVLLLSFVCCCRLFVVVQCRVHVYSVVCVHCFECTPSRRCDQILRPFYYEKRKKDNMYPGTLCVVRYTLCNSNKNVIRYKHSTCSGV